jgi:hypothetical protein
MAKTKDIATIPNAVSEKPAISKYYVLMVAIDHYPVHDNDPSLTISGLNNPVLDANNVLRILLERYDLGIPNTDQATDLRLTDDRYAAAKEPIWVYDTLQYKCLYNFNAAHDKILDHIDAVHAAICENDAFLIYFSGHGIVKSNSGFLLAGNALKNRTGWINYSELYNPFTNYLKDAKCRDLLLILDCCYSDAISLGKQGVNDSDLFSRKVMVSCGSDRLALDGEPSEGSPFANALVQALTENTQPMLSLAQIEGFMTSKVGEKTMGEQEINFGPLPVDWSGKGDFYFPLKGAIKEALPAQQLAASIVKYLNFKDQKAGFEDHFETLFERDFHLITTSAYNFDVQQLLRTVLFEHTRDVDMLNLVAGDPILLWPSSIPDGNFWDALQRSLTKLQISAGINKAEIIKVIVDRLQVMPEFVKKTFVIAVGYETGIDTDMTKLIGFCKEFMEMIEAEKRQRNHDCFAKLFLILSELTPGNSAFEVETALNIPKDAKYGLLNIDRVKDQDINVFTFERWQKEATKMMGKPLPALKKEELFTPTIKHYEILNLIDIISQKLQVDSGQVMQNIGILK